MITRKMRFEELVHDTILIVESREIAAAREKKSLTYSTYGLEVVDRKREKLQK